MILILAIALLPACAFLGSSKPAPNTSPAVTSTSSPPSPSPQPTLTGQPTEDCPPPSRREEIADFIAPAAGGSPVWAVMATTLSFSDVQQGALTSYGHAYKVLWVVEKDYPGKVSLSGSSMNGNPLWFQIDQEAVTDYPVLTMNNPSIPAQHPGFAEFPSYLYIPAPGCYFLKAYWDGGNWRVDFTVLE
jgi:hypothetical protein